jgi:hypothetical protein
MRSDPLGSTFAALADSTGRAILARLAQTRPCRLEPAGLKAVDGWLDDYRRLWGARLDRLDVLLRAEEGETDDHEP